MAADGGEPDQADAISPPEAGARQWPWMVGVWSLVLLVVLAAATVRLVDWMHHPDVFDGGFGYSGRTDVDQTLYVALLRPRDAASGSITIRDVQPAVRQNDAAAEITYLVCEESRHESLGGFLTARGTGGRRGLSGFCSGTHPAAGATLALDAEPPPVVVLAVTPRRPGHVVIGRQLISYRHGLQAGTEVLPVTVRVEATGG